VHPFDLKSALLARHAQHVVLVHFPIALFLVGVAFDFFGLWKKTRVLADAAYYDLLVAAVSVLPVMATGILAWRWQLEGQRLKGVLLSDGVDFGHADLAGVEHSFSGAPKSREQITGLPSAHRDSCCGGDRDDCPPWRLPQRCQRPGLDSGVSTGQK
jgi:hypothetical protein